MNFTFLQMLLYLSTIFLLFYAVFKDFKERLVTDYIWMFGTIIGIIVYLLNFMLNPEYIPIILPQIALNLLFALIIGVIFYLPKFLLDIGILGEADILAFFMIALLIPIRLNPEPYKYSILLLIPIIFDVIVNCFFIFGCFLVCIFFRNIFFFLRGNPLFSNTEGTLLKKLFIIFSGILIETINLDKYKHINLLEEFIFNNDEEKTENNNNEKHDKNSLNNHINSVQIIEIDENSKLGKDCGKWVLQPVFNYEEIFSSEELAQLKNEILSTEKKHIWITFLTPFMIFILLSVIITPWTGNFVFKILEMIF